MEPFGEVFGFPFVLEGFALAAVFLCADAAREGHPDLAGWFRTRALGTAALTGAAGLSGFLVLQTDAPRLFAGLVGRALPIVVVSAVAGLAAIALLVTRRYVPARIAPALAVAAILAGWAFAQYPYLLPPALTIADAARGRATLVATLVVLVLGSLVLVPALIYMYRLFQRALPASGNPADAPADGSMMNR